MDKARYLVEAHVLEERSVGELGELAAGVFSRASRMPARMAAKTAKPAQE